VKLNVLIALLLLEILLFMFTKAAILYLFIFSTIVMMMDEEVTIAEIKNKNDVVFDYVQTDDLRLKYDKKTGGYIRIGAIN
jgi:hypothetical protein